MSTMRFIRLSCVILLSFGSLLLSVIEENIATNLLDWQEKNINNNIDQSYVYLGKDRSNIIEVIMSIADLDDQKYSPLTELKEHVKQGFFFVEINDILDVVEYALLILQKKDSNDEFVQEITKNLNNVTDLLEQGILTVNASQLEIDQDYYRKNSCGSHCNSNRRTLVVNENMYVCGKAKFRKHIITKQGLHVEGKLKVDKNALFKNNVEVQGTLSVADLVVTSCLDSLCVNNLSVVDASVSGTLSVNDAFIVNGSIENLTITASVLDSVINNLTVNLTLSANDAIINGNLQFPNFTPAGILHNDALGNISSSLIVNADVDPAAAIVDTKLATISTAGKVDNSATTATSANTANTIVARNASGNFSAGVVSVTDSVVSTSLTVTPFGTAGVVHNNASGLLSSSLIVNADITNATISNAKLATISSANTAGNIVVRDGSGNFATNMITLNGTVTNPTDAATKAYVDAQIGGTGTNLNIPNTLVERDGTGSFAAQVVSVVDVVASGNLNLTTNPSLSTAGNIVKNGARFIHDFGMNNTFIGINSGNFTMTGSGNNGFGVTALSNCTSGSNNIAIGSTANFITTGSGNIYIGANGSVDESNVIRIGSGVTQCYIDGITGTAVGASAGVLVNINGQLGALVSSRRFKHDIVTMSDASENIYKLDPVEFAYNDDATNAKQFGLIAEDVDKVFPELVVYDGDHKPYAVQYHLLPVLLLNEIKKQHETINTLTITVETMNTAINKLQELVHECMQHIANMENK